MSSPDLLATIVATAEHITADRRERESLADLEVRAAQASPRGARFEQDLARAGHWNIIAECKRRSPSKGVLADPYDPAAIAAAYARGGATAISVLTEPTFFDGSLDHLAAVRATVDVPIIRKDFIVDEYQLWEARATGADAALLIVAALSQTRLVALQQCAWDIGLAALVEVHDADEMRRAIDSGARLIGVNNRNLHTLAVDIDASHQLAAMLPPAVVGVSESGLRTAADLVRLRAEGYRAFLIGERFMTAPDPAAAIGDLIGGERAE